MSAFLYGIVVQWKIDLRNRDIMLTYYVVPLVFFAFMGGIFTSINPDAKNTLIQSMTVFGVTMGSIIGAPTPLVQLYSSDIKKSYQVGGIPLWVGAINNFISAFIHLFMMSIVIFLVAPKIFNSKIPVNLFYYFIFLAIFIMVSLAVGTVLGVFIRNTSKLTMVSQLVFLPSIMLSGIMFPVNMLPKALEAVGMFFPAKWGYEIMTSEAIDIKFLIPLVVIMCIAISISANKLLKIK